MGINFIELTASASGYSVLVLVSDIKFIEQCEQGAKVHFKPWSGAEHHSVLPTVETYQEIKKLLKEEIGHGD